MKNATVQFELNGEECAEIVRSGSTLLTVLRTKKGDYSVKEGCQQGTCGSCTVLVNGEPKLSCILMAEDCEGSQVETLRGLECGESLHPLQQAFIDGFATQCGFCTPGMIMAAKVLLDKNSSPTREEVINAISGNFCRCTGYEPIIKAILAAADVCQVEH